MPIYTYRCENCGVQFERTQKFTDAPLAWCPECGKKALRKVYTPVGIVFKGSGFYATDHRSPSGNKWSPSSEDKSASDKSAAKPSAESSSSEKPAESKSSSSSSESTTPAAKPSNPQS